MKLLISYILSGFWLFNCFGQNIDASQHTIFVVLKNKQLTASINLKGAELTSLKRIKNNTEYIWQGNAKFWRQHSPILFPIIGSLKNGEYVYGGKRYQMPQHGFAKDMSFDLIDQTENSASFSLTNNKQTLKLYPFDFELVVTYQLIKNSLRVIYQVINRDNKSMYFSVGGHPGFNCPIKKGEKRSDYQLVFNKKEHVKIHLKSGKLRSGKTKDFLVNKKAIAITDALFDQGALIFSNLKSNTIQLKKGKERKLTFQFAGFPTLGIWSKNSDSPFICIEPWYGMPDPTYSNHELEEKEGIIHLAVGQKFKCHYEIKI